MVFASSLDLSFVTARAVPRVHRARYPRKSGGEERRYVTGKTHENESKEDKKYHHISTSLQTSVCGDCTCQLMGHPVWDWGHPEDSGPAVFFFDVQHWTWFFCTTLKMMRCDCGSSRVLDVSFSYLQVCEKLKQRKPCCERVMYLYIVVHILDPEVHLWSVAILLQTSHLGFVLSHHRPLMLHPWVVVEVVPWEFPTSCIPTSLQTPVCWDCICQLMGRPVWDWGHPEDSGPAGSFSLMCSIGPDFFCTTLKMMRCDCGSSRVLDVSFNYLSASGKLQ